MIIKKALVMKVITLGMSAPVLPAIESASLIVPSIRFSSQMVSPPRATNPPKATEQPVSEPVVPQLQDSPVPITQAPAEPSAPPAQREPLEPVPHKLPAKMEHASMVEVDTTLTSLAKVAQELAQQKLAVIEREEILEQWQARLEQEQVALDEKGVALEQHTTQLQNQTLAVDLKAEQLTLALAHVSGIRERLQGVLLELDHALDGQG